MRRRRFLLIAILIAAIAALLYWGLIDRVLVCTVIQPGGGDVVVRVDGRLLRPATVSPGSNSYSFSLRHGRYTITVEKPGFKAQKQTLDVKWGDGDEYPVFAPLRRLK